MFSGHVMFTNERSVARAMQGPADLKHVRHAAAKARIPNLRFSLHLRLNNLLCPPHVFFDHPRMVSIRGGHTHLIGCCFPLLAHRASLQVLCKGQKAQEQFGGDVADAGATGRTHWGGNCCRVDTEAGDGLDDIDGLFSFGFGGFGGGECSKEFSDSVLDWSEGSALDPAQKSEMTERAWRDEVHLGGGGGMWGLGAALGRLSMLNVGVSRAERCEHGGGWGFCLNQRSGHSHFEFAAQNPQANPKPLLRTASCRCGSLVVCTGVCGGAARRFAVGGRGCCR